MVAHAADDGSHGFLIGTASLKGPNDVRLLRYFEASCRNTSATTHDETCVLLRSVVVLPRLLNKPVLFSLQDEDETACVAAYNHPGEVVSMAASPSDPALLVTVQNALPGLKSTIWRMPDLPGLGDGDAPDATVAAQAAAGGGGANKDLVAVAHFPGTSSRVRTVAWAPVAGDAAFNRRTAESSSQLVSVEDSTIKSWQLKGDGTLASSGHAECQAPDMTYCGGVAWDPHHPSEVAVAADSSVHCWDVRSGDRLRTIANAVPSGLCVRSISFNPNKPWHVATAGDDFRVKIWDLRRLGGPVSANSAPVKVLDGHTHW